MLSGGKVDFDCGNSRCLSYFLETLVLLAPFCGRSIEVNLTGITNWAGELSVDAIRACWLPVFNKFILDDEILGIKVRPFYPSINYLNFLDQPSRFCPGWSRSRHIYEPSCQEIASSQGDCLANEACLFLFLALKSRESLQDQRIGLCLSRFTGICTSND